MNRSLFILNISEICTEFCCSEYSTKKHHKLAFGKMIDEHFANQYYQMQETSSYCFMSDYNTTLCKVKIVQHECSKIKATYKTFYALLLFILQNSCLLIFASLTKCHVTFFQHETIENFLHLMVLCCCVHINHSSGQIFIYFFFQHTI